MLVFRIREKCTLRSVFFFQAEDGIRDLVRSRGLGDVYKRQLKTCDAIGGVDEHPDGANSRKTPAGAKKVYETNAVSYTHLTLPTSDLV